MRTLLGLLVAGLLLLTPETASAQYWEEPDTLAHWNLSLAPGYGLLHVKGDNETRHGAGGRLMMGYAFTPNWEWDFIKVRLGVYDGDTGDEQGIYTTVTLTSAVRYTFDLEWVFPYIYMGLGWNRTGYDVEVYNRYTTHSLALEPGCGVSFHIVKSFWLGVEASVIPLILGNDNINGSLLFHGLLSFELKI